MSANNSITLGLQILGLEDAKQAASVLTQLKQLSGEMQQGGIFPGLQGPTQQARGGVTEYEQLNQQLTQNYKNLRPINQTIQEHEDQILSLGKAYGLMRQQAEQLDQTFVRMRSADRGQAMRNIAGFARSNGVDANQFGAQVAQFHQMGAVQSSADMTQLESILTQAVEKGSTAAYRLQMGDILPYLSSFTQQAMMVNPNGADIGGIASTLTALNASGSPGLRGAGGAQAYSALASDISQGSGFAGIVALQTYQQQNPGKGYGSFMYDRETLAQDPAYVNQYVANLFNSMGGLSDDPEKRKGQLALVASKTGMSAHELEAVAQGLANYDPQTKQLTPKTAINFADLRKKYGGKADADNAGASQTYLAMADNATNADQLDTALQQYKDASGDQGYKLTGATFEEQKKNLGQKIATSTSTFGRTRADQIQQGNADTNANLVEMGKNVRDTTQAIFGLNNAVGDLTAYIYSIPGVGQAAGLKQIGGEAISGVMGAAGGALGQYMMLRSIKSALPEVMQEVLQHPSFNPSMGGPLTGGPPVPTVAGPKLPGGPSVLPRTSPTAWGGAPLTGAATAGGAIGLGMMAAGVGVGWYALHEQTKTDDGNEAQRSEAEKQARYDRYKGDIEKYGTVRAGLMHPELMSMDTPQLDDLTARFKKDHGGQEAKAFGSTSGGAGDPKAPAATVSSPENDLATLAKRQIDLLDQINQKLDPNYDRTVQADHAGLADTGPAAAPTKSGRAAAPASSGAAAPGTAAGPVTGNWGHPDTAAIQKQLNSREGKASPISPKDIQELSAKYNVPEAMILGMLGQESGYGTDPGTLHDNFNYMGLTGKGTKGSVRVEGVDRDFAAFGSAREGLEAGVKNMASAQYQGLSLQEYAALYLTGNKNGTGDEKGNRVSDYVNNIEQVTRNMGGSVDGSSVPVTPSGGQQQQKLTAPAAGDIDPAAVQTSAKMGGFFGTVEVVVNQNGQKTSQLVRVGNQNGGPFAHLLNGPIGNGGLV